MSVCGCEISISPSARNLGFYIKDDMSVKLHVKNVCRSAYSELRRISTIRHLLSVDSTKTRCPPLSSLGLIIVTRFSQAALNIFLKNYKNYKAARLVLKAHKRDHVSPLLRTLHWLPIQTRIEYTLSTLCHSFFSNTAPVYLSDFLRVYSPLRQLRSSSDSRTLRIPQIKI